MLDCGNDIERVLFSQDQIERRCQELGELIDHDYEDNCPIIISLLTGALPFVAQLVKNIKGHVEMDFMKVSSYHGGTSSSNILKITKDIERSIEGRDIIIVDDIIDTGLTFLKVIELLNARNPRSIKTMALLDKKAGRKNKIDTDYVGFEVENCFVVGFGLDYNEKYRNLPYIGVLKECVYK